MFTESKYFGTPEYTLVFERLKAVANKRELLIGYSIVFDLMKLKPGNYAASEAGHMLGEISERMHSEGKPMLSAVVVNQQTGMPGDGFFVLASMLEKLSSDATAEQREAFWKRGLKAVYSTSW